MSGTAARQGISIDFLPPVVLIPLGIIVLFFWFAGTSVQVLTSEAWFAHTSVSPFSLVLTFQQIGQFVSGRMTWEQLFPFIFAWGVQFALILTSIGIEMPRHPAWRFWTAWAISIGLIVINSCGDYQTTAPYGGWSQIGFTIVLLFVTFCLGLLAITCFVHAYRKLVA